MRYRFHESLSHDPVHGYIPFTSPDGEGVSEREIIDHPWIQRLRQIHQLQTAWWVFPSAEHTRFQHVLGAMHLASRATEKLYPSLRAVWPEVPSRGYVESLMRMAALLHDVGHGPFGHFFDQYFLADFGLTHETLGGEIIRRELAQLLRGVRRNPNSALEPGETLDPEQIAMLISRPTAAHDGGPRWLAALRSLFSGLYTVDNMDFVLRDAYMSGYSARSFDLDRLLHYSFFTEHGLTVHERGLSALVRFMSVRAELFRSIYFHRTVRAIDLALRDLFAVSRTLLFPGNPLEHLHEYQRFTEWSLLADVARWGESDDPRRRELAPAWTRFLARDIHWRMVVERTIRFGPDQSEESSVFSNAAVFEAAIRSHLPAGLVQLPLRIDIARLVHRPGAHLPVGKLNFLYDPASDQIRRLDEREIYRETPLSYRICRVYSNTTEHRAALAKAMDSITRGLAADDLTNM